MKLRIYQINTERDTEGVAFESFDRTLRLAAASQIDPSIYDLVYDGTVDTDNIELVYEIFNLRHPSDFLGRSMSVSDIVEIVSSGSDRCKPGFYFCDSIGFKPIEFDPRGLPDVTAKKLTCVLCEPGKKAKITTVADSLRSLSEAVGGPIEIVPAFDERDVVIVCNRDGKIDFLRPCRALCDKDGNVDDVVFGPFLILGSKDDLTVSLTPEQAERYCDLFSFPERFVSVNGATRAIPYDPKRFALDR